MKKFAQMGMLLQVYGGLLTNRQKDTMDLYYNYDLSLAEIAEQIDISRQGVHDLIKRSEQILLNADDNIGVVEFQSKISNGIKELMEGLDTISNWSQKEIKENPGEIKNRLGDIRDKVLKLENIEL